MKDEKNKLLKLLKNKKIVLITEYFSQKLGGAEKSIESLLKKLNQKIDVITFENTQVKNERQSNFNIKNIKTDEKILRFAKIKTISSKLNKLNLNKYDYILTQTLIAPFIINKYPDKSIYFIRDELNLNEFNNYEEGVRYYLKKIKDIIEKKNIENYMKENIKALRKAHLIVSNSKFMQKQLLKKYKKKSIVIYPEVDKINIDKSKKKEFITFFGGHSAMKGADIVFKIANKLKNEKFIIITKNTQKQYVKNNITYLPWGQNLNKVYSKTKLLLVPSKWNEAFGRIVLEAQSVKIPVITSNKGGLAEANKNKKFIIKKNSNINEWIQKILKTI